MRDLDDWQLLQKAGRGDEQACAEIMRRYERLLFYIPRRYGLGQADSADVVQSTFLAMLDRLHTFHAESNLKGWLTVVCKRRCWELLQRFDNEQVHSEPLTDSLLLMGHTTTDSDRFATVQWLQDGLNALDDRCRDLLLLLYFSSEQPSYEQVATELGIKEGSVGPTRGRCLKRLRKALEN